MARTAADHLQLEGNQAPVHPAVVNPQFGYAPRCAAVRPGHAARIEKEYAAPLFVSGDVSMSMQYHIDIGWRLFRRHMLQAQRQTSALQIERERPLIVAVTIAPNYRNSRSNRPKFVQNMFAADISHVPDLFGIFCQFKNSRRQSVVCVG